MKKVSRQSWVSAPPNISTTCSAENESDAAPVQSYVRLEEKRFHGAFRVDDQGYWHLSTDPDEPTYVGKPSHALDNAWIDLITR
jgi:hypothetical protein